MTVAVGGHEKKHNTAASLTCVGAGVTTAAAGSTFVCGVGWYDATHTDPTNVRDNKNGTTNYAQIGTTVTAADTNFQTAVYYLQNAAGGSGTAATITFPDQKDVITFWFVEITGGLTSGILDQSPAGKDSTVSPYVSNTTGTIVQASEVLLGFIMTFTNAGTETLTHGNSFTQLDAQGDANFFTGASSSRVVAATGTYNTSVTSSGAGTTEAISWILSFKDASVAAVSHPGKSSSQQLLDGTLPHLRMSPRSEREAQQFLRAQKRAYGFAAA